MKSLILAAAIIFSASAFAWRAPSHDYSEVLGASLKLNNACVTTSEVKSINAVKVCTNLEKRTSIEHGEGGATTVSTWVCTAYETKDLAFPRAFARTVCLQTSPISEVSNGECLKFGKKADFLPATIQTATLVDSNNSEGSTAYKFGTHTFPVCK